MSNEDGSPRLHLVSTSRASDGSFVAIAEIGTLFGVAPHRLIGGVAEVGGLAEALRRPPVRAAGTVALTDGEVITFGVLLPDLASLLGMKLHARRVREADRDAVDLWTCLELLAAAGEIKEFADDGFDEIREQLSIEFSDDGAAMSVVTAVVTSAEAVRRRTRLRGLVRAIG